MKIGTNGYRGKGRTPSGRYGVVPGETQDKETAEASSLAIVEAKRLPMVEASSLPMVEARSLPMMEARTLPMVEARRLPREMYNFYKMDQYETSSLEEARHKDFDIWLQDFDEQVRL